MGCVLWLTMHTSYGNAYALERQLNAVIVPASVALSAWLESVEARVPCAQESICLLRSPLPSFSFVLSLPVLSLTKGRSMDGEDFTPGS